MESPSKCKMNDGGTLREDNVRYRILMESTVHRVISRGAHIHEARLLKADGTVVTTKLKPVGEQWIGSQFQELETPFVCSAGDVIEIGVEASS